jgi:RHS repeat-associated protein
MSSEPTLDRKLAYLVLRFALGLSILMHGLVRLPHLAAFADATAKLFVATPLPTIIVRPFALTLVFLETAVGLLLVLGLWTRAALLLGVTYPTVPIGVSAMPNVCETTGSSSNNARVCFTYGTSAPGYNNGLLQTMTDAVGSENYTYNALEQLTQLQKVVNGSTYTTSYAYNLASQPTQITYPSGRVVQQSVDAIGRLCEIAPSTTGCGTASSPYATGFGFNTANQVTGLKYGNGLYASFGFAPDRLMLNCLDYSTTNRGSCTHDSTTLFGLSYSYPATPGNNGLISSITDGVDPGRNASYTYDSLYRLVTAATAGSTNYPAWGLKEAYDRYGNRNTQSTISGCTGITCPTFSSTASTSTNRLPSPYTYDASGNMTNDGYNTLVYDGENRAVSATNGSAAGAYVYDGNGLRVQKCLPSCNGSNPNTVYVFSGSKVIAEYDNGAAVTSPSREYIYSGAALLARIDSSGTRYYHQDHLSNRFVTNSSGGVLEQLGTFPFGEQWYNASSDKLLFTTYERDSESGNDYAQARYNNSRTGRFNSPDPIAGSTSDPQSLNRYSYVRNMPVMLTDPAGLTPQCNTVKTNERKPDSASGGGPAGDGYDSDSADPDPGAPQGTWPGCGEAAPWYDTAGGGGGTLDGIPFGDIPGGLMGNGESNSTFAVPLGDSLGFNSWVVDPFGNGWQNPTGGCVSGLGSGDIFCGGSDYAGGAEPEGGSEFDLYELGDPDGGGAAKKYGVNLKVLNDCLAKMGINTTINSFVPSTPGGFGQASGTGEDAFTGHGNTVPITVANDASSFNYAQIGQLCDVPGGAYGCTIRTQPYTNYTNNNNSAFGTVGTQVWELGNSLTSIQAGSIFVPIPIGPKEPGNILVKCVIAAHGIQPQ